MSQRDQPDRLPFRSSPYTTGPADSGGSKPGSVRPRRAPAHTSRGQGCRCGAMTTPDFCAGPDFYPDGLTSEPITAPQRAGQRPTTRRASRGPVEPGTDRTSDLTVEPALAATPAPESCVPPLSGAPGQPGGTGAAAGAGPSTGEPAGDPVPTLFTPTQAADLLQVPESWLRRRAARRLVPCTFLGKHLRFSRANLEQIITDAVRPAAADQRTAPGGSTAPRRRAKPATRVRTDSRRPAR